MKISCRRKELLCALTLCSVVFPIYMVFAFFNLKAPGNTVFLAVVYVIIPCIAMGILMAWAFRELRKCQSLTSKETLRWAVAIFLSGFIGAVFFLALDRSDEPDGG